ncbi:MAG: hypothetical protein OEV91_05540 [Desulfobulbaceae bacterium]|nr:hypothetical protein [Desulfobulbaceae bacterium]
MTDPIEAKVEELLRQGLDRRAAHRRLADTADRAKLLFFLNNSALAADRNRLQLPNLLLALLLGFVTAKRLIAIFSFGVIDLFLFLSLVVPMVNVYVLREVLRFHRLGYQFLLVLAALSLLQPENRLPLELTIYATMIGLTGFLLAKLFPKTALIPSELPPARPEGKNRHA